MDLVKSHKRRSRLSNVLYVGLNIGLALALLLIVRYVQSPWLAILLIALSKWRALAVKPRFWFANLVANMVDLIVGVSTVLLMYSASAEPWTQLILALLYMGWLLVIKPRSSHQMVAIQAGVSVFVGITALATISYSWDVTFFVLFMWLIGYSATRHTLGSYEEPMTSIYSLIGGVVFAEFGWIGFHWLFAYTLPHMGDIKIPQLAILVMLYSFVAERSYASFKRRNAINALDILMPVILALAVTIVLLVFYNRISLGITP